MHEKEIKKKILLILSSNNKAKQKNHGKIIKILVCLYGSPYGPLPFRYLI